MVNQEKACSSTYLKQEGFRLSGCLRKWSKSLVLSTCPIIYISTQGFFLLLPVSFIATRIYPNLTQGQEQLYERPLQFCLWWLCEGKGIHFKLEPGMGRWRLNKILVQLAQTRHQGLRTGQRVKSPRLSREWWSLCKASNEKVHFWFCSKRHCVHSESLDRELNDDRVLQGLS